MSKLKDLQEKRNGFAGKVEELRKAFTENGDKWKDDEQRTTWEKVNADFDAVTKEMGEVRSAEEVARRADEVKELQNRSVNDGRGIPGREDSDGQRRSDRRGQPNVTEDRQTAIAAWFRRQSGVEISKEERAACQRVGFNPAKRSIVLDLSPSGDFAMRQEEFRSVHPSLHKRNLGTGTGSAGKTIPTGFIPQLEEAMLAHGPMLQLADVMVTSSGNNLPHPTANDTANEGEIVGQAATIGNSVDPTFSDMTLGAFKFSSKLVKVSAEILEDSAFDLNRVLSRMLGERLGRAMNRKYTVGAGTTEPFGIVTQATLGVTCASATAITSDEILNLIHSVDPAYRSAPGVRFMMHDSVVLYLRKLKDTTGQYLWQPGLQLGVPDRFSGYIVSVNQHMASAIAATNRTILFGDISKYKARHVKQIRLKRLAERYADTDEEGFIAFQRADGNLLDAGVAPVKYLRQL